MAIQVTNYSIGLENGLHTVDSGNGPYIDLNRQVGELILQGWFGEPIKQQSAWKLDPPKDFQ
jgi:hypothetical protein